MTKLDEDTEPDLKVPSKLKETLEQGKAIGTVVILVLTAAMSIYHFFRPEAEARASYETLKPVVEDNANQLRELQGKIDVLEKLVLRDYGSRIEFDGDGLMDSMAPTMSPKAVPSARLVLPDAPWEQKK
jgi:hypothetical protein